MAIPFYKDTEGAWWLEKSIRPQGTYELREEGNGKFSIIDIHKPYTLFSNKLFSDFVDEQGDPYASESDFLKAVKVFFSTRVILWDDMSAPLVLQPIKNQNSAIQYDYEELELLIGRNATYEEDWISYVKQLPHGYAQGKNLNPHLHAIFTSNNLPHMLLAWRWYNNGEAPSAWSYSSYTELLFPYENGKMNILLFPDFEKENAKISSNVDVRIMRDVDNDSGLFQGADPYPGDIRLKFFDIHVPSDADGSYQRFYK